MAAAALRWKTCGKCLEALWRGGIFAPFTVCRGLWRAFLPIPRQFRCFLISAALPGFLFHGARFERSAPLFPPCGCAICCSPRPVAVPPLAPYLKTPAHQRITTTMSTTIIATSWRCKTLSLRVPRYFRSRPILSSPISLRVFLCMECPPAQDITAVLRKLQLKIQRSLRLPARSVPPSAF